VQEGGDNISHNVEFTSDNFKEFINVIGRYKNTSINTTIEDFFKSFKYQIVNTVEERIERQIYFMRIISKSNNSITCTFMLNLNTSEMSQQLKNKENSIINVFRHDRQITTLNLNKQNTELGAFGQKPMSHITSVFLYSIN